MEYLAAVLMIFNVLFFIASSFAKNKTWFLMFLIISTAFFIAQYVCYFAWVAIIILIVDAVRLVAFFVYEKKGLGKAWQISTCAVLYVISLVLSIVFWKSWFDIFPLIGLAGVYITICFNRLSVVKFGNVFTAICSVIYLFLIGSIFNGVLELIMAIFSLVGFIFQIVKEVKTKHSNQTYAQKT